MIFLEPISILGIFLISLYLIRRNFEISIYLLLILSVLLHKELFSFYTWDLLPVRVYMFALLCSFIYDTTYKIFKKGEIKTRLLELLKNAPAIILIVLWLIQGVSILNSLNLKASISLYGFFTTTVVLFATFTTKFGEDKVKTFKYIKAYVLIGFLLTLFGYFQLELYARTGKIIGALWNVPDNIPRIGATFWDINHYGAYLASLLPIASILVLTERKIKNKLFYALVSLSLLVSVLLTNSRSAWIMVFVSFVVFCLVFFVTKFGKKGILILITPLIIAAAVAGIAYSQKNGSFRFVVKQYFHYRLDSFDSHVLLLEGSFQIFEKHPILGGGYGSFFEQLNKTKIGPEFFARDPAAFTTRVPAHTIWGELLSGSGILGFSVFLLFALTVIGVLIYAAHKNKGKPEFLINSVMAAVLVGWLAAGIFYSYNTEFFWIIWTLFLTYGVASAGLKNNFGEVLDFYVKSEWASKLSILAVSFVLIFWSLGSNHLIPWDEAIYAKIAKNMAETGNYISQAWKSGVVWYEKPPFYMWMEAGLMYIFGASEFLVRLPSAIAGFLTLILVYKISRKLFSKTAAFISVLSLVTTTHFLYYSRTGMLDVTTTFFITLAIYFYILLKEKGPLYYALLVGLAIGFASMTKGVIGLIPFPVILLIEMFSTKRSKISNYLYCLLGFSIVALPWHIQMYRLYGPAFLNNYIGYHVLDRATNAIEDKGNPIWWYLIILKVSMRIWFISLLGALPFSFYKLVKKDTRPKIFLIWFVFVLTLFSVSKSKLVWYLVPIYPAAAILNGYFLDELLATVSYFLVKRKVVFINQTVLKTLSLYVLLMFSLCYLVLNKDLVYTSDLTGSQSRLMELKESTFGEKTTVYLDRVELPLALYYLKGPFRIIDFSPKIAARVPEVPANQPLILLTKQGRFSEQVARYTYPPAVVKTDGDWILWLMPARDGSTRFRRELSPTE